MLGLDSAEQQPPVVVENSLVSQGLDNCTAEAGEEGLRGVALRDRMQPRAAWQLPIRDRNEVLYRWLQQSIRDPKGVLSRFPG